MSSRASFDKLLLLPRSVPSTTTCQLSQALWRGRHTNLLAFSLLGDHHCRRCYETGDGTVGTLRSENFGETFIRLLSCYTLFSGYRPPWPPRNCSYERLPFRMLQGVNCFTTDLFVLHTAESASPVLLTKTRPTRRSRLLTIVHPINGRCAFRV